MPKYTAFFLFLLSFSTIAQQKIDEELLIFVQKKTDSEFTQKNILELVAEMDSLSIPTKVINIDQIGAPQEVGYTPYIVYRNHLGNKVYKGRSTSHKRILNFIRTVRRLPQADIDYEEKNVLVWKHPKANLIFKLKITDPNGTVPSDFDKKKFEKEYLEGLKKGFEGTHFVKSQHVTNSDEIFYCNFYPYIAEDGKIYVSHEIFSHYDCIKPVYQQFKTASVGTTMEEVFALAGAVNFAEIKRQIVESKIGDAYNFVPKTIKTIKWEDLNLKKLEAPQKSIQTTIKDVQFPTKWTILGAIDEGTPMLSFNFPPPLRQYGGELKQVSGTITLVDNQSLENALGEFVTEVSSLEMGVGSLNSAVKESMLFVKKFPTARLVFKKILSKDFKLEIGKITRVEIEADLTIVDQTGPVLATAQFEPFLNELGELLLSVTTQFVAEDLTGSYHIDGPDGPTEANNRMFFDASFLMKAFDND